MLATHEDALRADLIRFYGVRLDDAISSRSWSDLSAMCAHLPSESAVIRAEGDGWSESERLLAEIARNTQIIWWQRTDHSVVGNEEPVRYMSPSERNVALSARGASLEERMRSVASAYGYEEVLDGQG